MANVKQDRGARPDQKPQNQTGEERGPIKGPQVDKHSMRRKDTARGSEPETRSASSGRS